MSNTALQPQAAAPMSSSDAEVQAALVSADDPDATPQERAEMLMEIARGLQIRPRSAQPLRDAVTLCRRALSLLDPSASEIDALLAARVQALQGTALQALPGQPDDGEPALRQAQDCYEAARPVLARLGTPEETAELDRKSVV